MKRFLFVLVVLVLTGAGIADGADPIRIAAIFPKVGVAALEITYNFRGVELAVEEINAKGGVLGRPLEIIELDNKGTAIGSQETAETAVKMGVTAVIGSTWSSHSLAMAPVLQAAKIPMITNISTDPDVTRVGDYIFRVCFIDPFQGKVMAHFGRYDLKAETAVVLKDVSSQYSVGLSEFFIHDFKQLGGKVLWEGKYIQKDVDFTNMLKEVKARNPDIIFLPGYSRDSGLIIGQSRDMGIKSIFLGGDGWGTLIYDLVGKVVEGSYFCGHTHPESPFPKNLRLREHYRQKYNSEIPIEGLILAYDAVWVLSDAITRAGSTDRTKIRDALAKTKDYPVATGTITFDDNGDPINKEAVIFKFDNGKGVYIKTVKPNSN